jgi:hypothetical protein
MDFLPLPLHAGQEVVLWPWHFGHNNFWGIVSSHAYVPQKEPQAVLHASRDREVCRLVRLLGLGCQESGPAQSGLIKPLAM